MFAADTGDGNAPTLAVAQEIANKDAAATGQGTLDGPPELLFLGVDIVYPEPSADSMQNRFIEPFSEAFELSTEQQLKCKRAYKSQASFDNKAYDHLRQELLSSGVENVYSGSLFQNNELKHRPLQTFGKDDAPDGGGKRKCLR